MPSYLTHKYLGDKRAAKTLRHAGLHQLGILKNAMRFQGLQQNRRVVEFSDGTWIICTSAFNIDTVNIYVPPLLPVGGERKVVKEEYCWCTNYFTEGKVLEVIISELNEGSYPPFYNKYEYYTEIFSTKIKHEKDYNGVRYKVEVCRGAQKTAVVCAASDLTTYEVGDVVILFCAGNYVDNGNRLEYSPSILNTFPGKVSCPGKFGNCFACNATLKSTETAEELEGTYVIVPLSFVRTETAAEDVLELVTPIQLEQGNLFLGALVKDESQPEFEGIDSKINFEKNTVHLQLSDDNDSKVTARICCNAAKPPLTYEDRVRMAVFSYQENRANFELLVLEVSELGAEEFDYFVIGYKFNTPVRCPHRIFRGTVRYYYGVPTEEYKLVKIHDKDTDKPLDIIKGLTWDEEDTKYIAIEGNKSYFIVTTPGNWVTVRTNTGPVPFNWYFGIVPQTMTLNISFDGSRSGYSYGETYYFQILYAKEVFSASSHVYRDSSKIYKLQPLKFYGLSVGYNPAQGQYSKPKPICYLTSEIHEIVDGDAIYYRNDEGGITGGEGYTYLTWSGNTQYMNKNQAVVFTYDYEITNDYEAAWHYDKYRAQVIDYARREIYVTRTNELLWEQITPVKTLGSKTMGILHTYICMTWEAENVQVNGHYSQYDDLRPLPAENNITVFATMYIADDIKDINNCSLDDFNILGDTGEESLFIEEFKEDIKTAYIHLVNNHPDAYLAIDMVDGFCVDNT